MMSRDLERDLQSDESKGQQTSYTKGLAIHILHRKVKKLLEDIVGIGVVINDN